VIDAAVEWAGDVAHLLLESRGTAVVAEIERAPLALAVVRSKSLEPVATTPMWRSLFGPTVPAGVRTAIGLASSGASRARVADLVFRRTPEAIERTCHTVAHPGDELTVIGCIDITDEVLARRLGLPPTALIWSYRDDAVTDYANAPWSSYTGVTLEQGWQIAIHADDLAACEATRPGADVDIRVRSASGDYRWHRVRRVRTDDQDRHTVTAVDIHEAHAARIELANALERERAARAEAERANQSKDQFLAVVSHELRAPVATLMMWEKVLRDHSDDPELRRRSIDAIRASAASQARLVADLLDVSRAVSGKLHVERRRISIDDVLSSAIQGITPVAKAKQHELVTDIERRLGKVRGDSSRLLQVFENLLSNAVKFTPAGGRITVSAKREDQEIVIEVSDTGVGIPPDLLPKLFVPFSQSDDIVTRAQGGLGLGLAISREIVALHDGNLIAASPGPGKGATFTMRLPATPRRAASTPVGTPTTKVQRLDGVRILIVDDDDRLRGALTTLLHRAGAIVEVAESAAQARSMLDEFAPEVLLCDIAMPEEDGYTFVRKLRADPQRNHLPALALTAYASELDRADSAAAGFDRHIAKPVEFEHLVASIEGVLAERRSPQNA
jgi:signal transduction histidine kinase/ActR/RegA family two-component response regulator